MHSLATLEPDLVMNTGDNLSHVDGMDATGGTRPAHGLPRRICARLELLFRAGFQEPGTLPVAAAHPADD